MQPISQKSFCTSLSYEQRNLAIVSTVSVIAMTYFSNVKNRVLLLNYFLPGCTMSVNITASTFEKIEHGITKNQNRDYIRIAFLVGLVICGKKQWHYATAAIYALGYGRLCYTELNDQMLSEIRQDIQTKGLSEKVWEVKETQSLCQFLQESKIHSLKDGDELGDKYYQINLSDHRKVFANRRVEYLNENKYIYFIFYIERFSHTDLYSKKPAYMSLKSTIENHMSAAFDFMRFPFENRNYETPEYRVTGDQNEALFKRTTIYTGQYPGIRAFV